MLGILLSMGLVFVISVLWMWGDRQANGGRPGGLERFIDWIGHR